MKAAPPKLRSKFENYTLILYSKLQLIEIFGTPPPAPRFMPRHQKCSAVVKKTSIYGKIWKGKCKRNAVEKCNGMCQQHFYLSQGIHVVNSSINRETTSPDLYQSIPLPDYKHNDFWRTSLPKELWIKEIVPRLELKSLGNLYRTCHSMFETFATNEWFENHSYYALLTEARDDTRIIYTHYDLNVETNDYTHYGINPTNLLFKKRDILFGVQHRISSSHHDWNQLCVHKISSYKYLRDAKILVSASNMESFHQRSVNYVRDNIMRYHLEEVSRFIRGANDIDSEFIMLTLACDVKNPVMQTYVDELTTVIHNDSPSLHLMTSGNYIWISKSAITLL